MNAQELQESIDLLETAESKKCKKRKLMGMDENKLLDYMLIKELITLDNALLKSDQEIKSQKEIIDDLKKVIESSNTKMIEMGNTKLIEKFDLKLNTYYFCLVFSFLMNVYLSISI